MADNESGAAPSARTTAEEVFEKGNLGDVRQGVDSVFETGSVGSVSSAIGDSFFGINHRQTPNPISINRDLFGLTFFTRPRLNFSAENLRHSRLMYPLLTQNDKSIARIIRCLLDPNINKGKVPSPGNQGITSPFVDPQQAFIPILTNNLLSASGWPDVIAPLFEAPEGVYKETYALVDGISVDYSTYDIQANFRNLPGDPITRLFFYWVHYMSLVFRGEMVAYPDDIVTREVNYNTRIYRLVLDSTKTKVQKIGACGAAIPTVSPMGAAFNFESDRPYNNSNDQISIRFRCMGAIYDDPILLFAFNETVCMFNDSMRDGNRSRHLTKVPMQLLNLFNNNGYPRINTDTYELEWWVPTEEYKARFPNRSQI